MTLVLTIASMERLDNGEAAQLRLDRHGALIGRSPHMDWSLPDPKSHISSSHCEIEYRDGGYVLIDKSTNGTYVNNATARIAGPHRIADGDVILIGHYEITARLEAGGAASSPPQTVDTGYNGGSQNGPEWGGWDSHSAGAGSVGVDPAKWDRPPPQAAISGQGSVSAHWAPPKVESAWNTPEAPKAQPSGWSSEPNAPAPPSAHDIWGQLAGSNEVDWSRGFGGTPNPIQSDAVTYGQGQASFGQQTPSFQQASPASSFGSAPAPGGGANAGWGPSSAPAAAPAPAPSAPPMSPMPSGGGSEWQAFLAGTGLQPSDFRSGPTDVMRTAGMLLRRVVGGMVVMMEARARAKAQLGAQSTSLEFDGNNPLKFARSAEGALAQLLSPPERGFMASDRAIEDAFRDLQAHQLATLTAMQGALAETLERFSPAAIRERAETKGLMAKIVPGAAAAALWKAYEQEFEGVTQGSDEAFMDVFAKEFREAYERVAAEMKAKQRGSF